MLSQRPHENTGNRNEQKRSCPVIHYQPVFLKLAAFRIFIVLRRLAQPLLAACRDGVAKVVRQRPKQNSRLSTVPRDQEENPCAPTFTAYLAWRRPCGKLKAKRSSRVCAVARRMCCLDHTICIHALLTETGDRPRQALGRRYLHLLIVLDRRWGDVTFIKVTSTLHTPLPPFLSNFLVCNTTRNAKLDRE